MTRVESRFILTPMMHGVIAGGADLNIIPDPSQKTTYFGATTCLGIGSPGVEAHIERSYTTTWNCTRYNVFALAEYIYIKIKEG